LAVTDGSGDGGAACVAAGAFEVAMSCSGKDGKACAIVALGAGSAAPACAASVLGLGCAVSPRGQNAISVTKNVPIAAPAIQ
jgi:malic enzyme